ncbi:hypothetical protein LRM44_00725 [Candidatus Nanosynbacter sp. HMT-352]|uniref:hypothetical protein n=1 Tax=Candidatus Nanosynbacter sp. HMT-352 TaxID=2899133 RepID=UPI001FB772A2|nr:hypothetical protein [Candidatus Nanosynbacter sp. HMT-352]UOG66586.1 hypothetical protein LRM44_00725 [Candidatus Nanosynbacter sp. HMT-352]
MKKMILSALIVACSVFGFSAISVASLSTNVSAQAANSVVKKGIKTATTADMENKSIAGEGGLISILINFLLWAVGILSVAMIIFSGFRYITSAGDAAKTKSAQTALTYSIVGLIVAVLAWVIVKMILRQFGIEVKTN